MKKLHFILIGLFCSIFCIGGCSNDDNEQTEETDTDDYETLMGDTMNRDRVISMLCTADTLSVGTIEYTPINGKALDISYPTVFSIGMDDENEARNFFYTHCVPTGEEDNVIENSDGTLVYSLGSCGSLKYTPTNTTSMLAYINVDIHGLDCMTKIELIPNSLWPYNDYSPFDVGDVLKSNETIKNGQETKVVTAWWLCVRAYSGGKAGILMTWDNEVGLKKVDRSDHYKSYTKVTGCASKDAWSALAQFYYDDVEAYKGMCNTLKSVIPYNFFSWSYESSLISMMEKLISNYTYTHQVGDMNDHKGTWRARSVWYCHGEYIETGPNCINIDERNGNLPDFKYSRWDCIRNEIDDDLDYTNSHSITFSPYDGKDWSKYVKKYPINE